MAFKYIDRVYWVFDKLSIRTYTVSLGIDCLSTLSYIYIYYDVITYMKLVDISA